MKKIILIFFLLSIFSGKAQNITYGVLVGGHIYDIITPKADEGFRGYIGYTILNRGGLPGDIGVFVDAKINESLGIKTNIFHSQSYDEYADDDTPNNYINDYLISSIQIQPALKIDANKEYGKGFYFLTGLRLNYILQTTHDQSDNEIGGLYKKASYGIQGGFGFMFSRLIGFEIRGDVSISNMLDSSKRSARTNGAYGNFFVVIN
jgi:hypothetical protein